MKGKERENTEVKVLPSSFPSLPSPVVECQWLLLVSCAHLWLQEEAGSDPYLQDHETQDDGYGEAETQGETILRWPCPLFPSPCQMPSEKEE